MPLGERKLPLLERDHAPLNFARLHHTTLPHHGDAAYPHYQAERNVALANALKQLSEELACRSNVQRLEFGNQKLTVQYHSQSKLSQQELADLQQATHFDKKELQQWYKGTKQHAHTMSGRG